MWPPYEAASTADWYPLNKPTGDEGLYGFTMLVLFSSGGSVESFLSRLFTVGEPTSGRDFFIVFVGSRSKMYCSELESPYLLIPV